MASKPNPGSRAMRLILRYLIAGSVRERKPIFRRLKLLPPQPRLLLSSVSHRRLIRTLLLVIRRLCRVSWAHVARRSWSGTRVSRARLIATTLARTTAAARATAATTTATAVATAWGGAATTATSDRRIVVVATRTASATAAGKGRETDEGGQNESVSRHATTPLEKKSRLLRIR